MAKLLTFDISYIWHLLHLASIMFSTISDESFLQFYLEIKIAVQIVKHEITFFHKTSVVLNFKWTILTCMINTNYSIIKFIKFSI